MWGSQRALGSTRRSAGSVRFSSMSMSSLQEAWGWARTWLFDAAWPLWARASVDPMGGFLDQLGDAGEPVVATKRLRVQGRQIFVFAEAGRAGWTGPWRDLVAHGLREVRAVLAGESQLASATGDGQSVAGVSLYDQAFLILALAHAHRAGGDPDLEVEAISVWEGLVERFGRPDGGFDEPAAANAVFQSNPHMHLYEAAQAWRAVSSHAIWPEAMARFRRLFTQVFFDVGALQVKEFFATDGRPAPGALGDEAWPGHQFEWTWLLLGDPDADHATAARMARRAAETGVDRMRQVVIFSQTGQGKPLDSSARLWSQAERLRGALAMREAGQDAAFWTNEALQAVTTIRRYAEAAPLPGLYRDLMLKDGSFVVEPSKASSLYHLTGAFMALRDAADA